MSVMFIMTSVLIICLLKIAEWRRLRDCRRKSYCLHSAIAEGGNRPSVGRHDVREAVRLERSRTAFSCLLPPIDPVLTGAYFACRTAIGSTPNSSEAANLGPLICLFATTTPAISQKSS